MAITDDPNNLQSELPKLLIVAGHPRSGTSILNRICDSHPDIVMTREFVNMVLPQSYNEHFSRIRKNFFRKTPLLYTPGSTKKKLKSMFFLVRYLFWLLIDSRGYITADVMQQTMHRLFPEARLIGDKKPTYLRLLSNFEQANTHYVVIYRDGRDVVQSALNRSWGKNNTRFASARSAAENWVRVIGTMEQHRERFHIIRYEDFVTNPKAELASLAEYLNVDPAGFDHKQIKSSSVGRYKQMLTEEQIAEVVEIAGPTLERLGYVLD